MSGNARESGRSTIDRLFALLDVFDGQELTLGEVSDRSDLPLTTTHRMLAALERWGGVERDADGRYSVGLRLWELGTRATTPWRLRELALPVMQDLYELTHQNVQLAVLDHGSALVIERLGGLKSVRTLTEVGSRLPLHATGVGKVLLASSPRLLAEVAGGRLQRFTPHTQVMPGLLVADVQRTARSSVALAREEFTLGASSVAVPVARGDRFPLSALSIVTHSHIDPASHARTLAEAARRLSRRLADDVSPTSASMMPSIGPGSAARQSIRVNYSRATRLRRDAMEERVAAQ